MLIDNLDKTIKMNLQLLAGEGGDGGEGSSSQQSHNNNEGNNSNNSSGDTNKPEQKTYTQEELDTLLNDAKKDLPSEEELNKFKEWKESQKSEEQKKNEKLEAETKARKEAEDKVSTLEAKVECLSKGVSKDSVDDVITLAKSMGTDTLTIDKAIDKVLEKYPYFKSSNETPSLETPGFKVGGSGGNKQPQDNINDAIAMAFGNK